MRSMSSHSSEIYGISNASTQKIYKCYMLIQSWDINCAFWDRKMSPWSLRHVATTYIWNHFILSGDIVRKTKWDRQTESNVCSIITCEQEVFIQMEIVLWLSHECQYTYYNWPHFRKQSVQPIPTVYIQHGQPKLPPRWNSSSVTYWRI